MRPSKQVLLVASAVSLLTSALAHADTVVQIPIDSLANARPVSTVSGGVVTIWSPGQGVDGGDGFVTASVFSLFLTAHPTFFGAGNPMGGALPDDGSFPANADHPLVVLHFSNTDSTTSPQTFQILAEGTSEVAVPQATYSSLYLIMTSSGGGQPNLSVTLKYADASTAMVPVPLNDYDTNLSASTATVTFFNLAPGMHKWSGASAMYPYGSPGDGSR